MGDTVGTHRSGRGHGPRAGVDEKTVMELKDLFNEFIQSRSGSATDFVDLCGGPKAFNEIQDGLKIVSKMLDRVTISTFEGPKKVVAAELSIRFLNTLFSATLPGVPQGIMSVGISTLKRLKDWKVGESTKTFRSDMVESIERFIQYYQHAVPAKPVYFVGREYKCLGYPLGRGYPLGGSCDDWAVDVRCYSAKDFTNGELTQVLPQITPLCENCALVFDRKNLRRKQRDLEACQKDLSERDAELAQLRFELAVRDTRIQELEDGQREMEEQLDEALDNSDDKAHAITAGANIMMAEQFTQTQQEFTDLRRHIDRIRAEHAVFVLEAQRADAATAASSQELERVLSDLSDETYGTANSM